MHEHFRYQSLVISWDYVWFGWDMIAKGEGYWCKARFNCIKYALTVGNNFFLKKGKKLEIRKEGPRKFQ